MLVADSEETVKVTLVKDGYAYVESKKASACGSCASKSSCGSLNFFSSDSRKEPQLRILNTLNLREGDSAVLTIASDKLILGTFLMYLLPLFSLIFVASIAKYYGGEVFSTITGLVSLFVTLFIVKSILNKKKVSKQFEPQFLRKVINVETE